MTALPWIVFRLFGAASRLARIRGLLALHLFLVFWWLQAVPEDTHLAAANTWRARLCLQALSFLLWLEAIWSCWDSSAQSRAERAARSSTWAKLLQPLSAGSLLRHACPQLLLLSLAFCGTVLLLLLEQMKFHVELGLLSAWLTQVLTWTLLLDLSSLLHKARSRMLLVLLFGLIMHVLFPVSAPAAGSGWQALVFSLLALWLVLGLGLRRDRDADCHSG